MTERICSIDDCDRPVVARGWCSKHWQRWQRHGDPLYVAPAPGARTDPVRRFWSKASVDEPDACWEWTSKNRDRDGYGYFKVAGRMWRAPRYAFNLANPDAPIGDDEMVCHTCDNPPCVNPAHLIRGAALDNSADQVERDRTVTGDRHHTRRDPSTRRRGEANGSARLTAEQVLEIRRRYAAGEKQVPLAAVFGVSQPIISQIIRRKVWTHLEE